MLARSYTQQPTAQTTYTGRTACGGRIYLLVLLLHLGDLFVEQCILAGARLECRGGGSKALLQTPTRLSRALQL